MAEVVTFVGYRPPVRYDAVPWTEVRIQESATEDGTYAQLEAIPLTPGRHGSVAAGGPVVHDRARHSVGLLVPGRVRGRHRRHQSVPTTPVQNVAGGSVPTISPVRRRCRARPRTAVAGGNAGAGGRDAPGDPGRVSPDRQLPRARRHRTSRPTRPSSSQVCLDIAVDLWKQEQSPFGVVVVGRRSRASPTRPGTRGAGTPKTLLAAENRVRDRVGGVAVEIVEAMAEALDPVKTEIPELQMYPYLNQNPTPPSIDIYPADPFQTGSGFEDDTDLFFTVRARTTTADHEAGQKALLRMLDRRAAESVEAALTSDQSLGGTAQAVAVAAEGVSGYREYLENPQSNGHPDRVRMEGAGDRMKTTYKVMAGTFQGHQPGRGVRGRPGPGAGAPGDGARPDQVVKRASHSKKEGKTDG